MNGGSRAVCTGRWRNCAASRRGPGTRGDGHAGRSLTFAGSLPGGSTVCDAGKIGFVWRKCSAGHPYARDRVWQPGAACCRRAWRGHPFGLALRAGTAHAHQKLARARCPCCSWAGCPCHSWAGRPCYGNGSRGGPSFRYSIIPPFQPRSDGAGGGTLVRNKAKRQ